MKFPAALTCLMLMAPLVPTMASEDLPFGDWQVTAVALQDPDQPVAAIIVDDPLYMGVTLSVDANAMVWAGGSKTNPAGPELEDCLSPQIVPAIDARNPIIVEPDVLAVLCGDEAWGPGAVYTFQGPDVIQLWWFDGALLTLTRIEG